MANEILTHTSGAIICWADSSQYNDPGNIYARTHEIRLKSLASNAARQGAKVDLGIKRASGYLVRGAVSFAVAPTAGSPVEYYWSSSNTSQPASGNAGGYGSIPYISGVDGPYTPAGGTETDIDEYKQLLSFIGIIPATADAENTQSKIINSYFIPPERYGSIVVKNDGGQAFSANGSGIYIVMIPVVDEI